MIQGIKSTAKSSIIYGLGNISTKLVGIILLPLFTDTDILSVDNYGVLGITEVTIQVLVALFGLSLYQALFRWYWDKNHITNRKSIFFTLFTFLSFFSGLFLVLGFFFSSSLSVLLFNKDLFARVVFLMLGSVALQVISQLPMSLMRLEDKAIEYTVTNLIRLVVSLVLTVIFITKLNRGLEGIYEAQIVGNLVYFLFTAKYIYNRTKPVFNYTILKEMLAYSLPLTVASVFGVLLASLDRYVLNYKATLLDVGIYSTAYKLANTIRVFIIHSVQLAVAPSIFKLMNHPNNKEIYSRIMTYFTVLVIYASLVLSIFGREVLELFASDPVYFSAYKLIPILCIGILLGTAKDVAINGLNIVKKTKIVSIIVPVIAVFHLGLNYLLISILGVYGAAIASAISQAIFFFAVLYFAQKHYPIPYEFGRILISLVIATALFAIGISVTFNSLVVSLLFKVLLVIVFPVLLWVFPFLKIDEKQWVFGVINRLKAIMFRNRI
jgi:O-antigen/teichoic acid export membrane protein